MSDSLVEIGYVRRAVGLDGRVEVALNSGDISRLREGTRLFVGSSSMDVAKASRGRKGLFNVWFEGVTDRDSADLLRGLALEIPETEIPVLPEGTYYHYQVIGLAVVDADRRPIGNVAGIMETGANDVYVVARPSGDEILIPVTPTTIKEVDIVEGVITVDLPPGLIAD